VHESARVVKLKTSRVIEWAGVEFQPNLLKPVKPVKLGLILLDMNMPSIGIDVIGRAPNRDAPPSEFEGIGDITMSLVANWIENICKDAHETDVENIFDFLAKRWRWNLYLIEPKLIRGSEAHGSLETIAKKFTKNLSASRLNRR
jgi:hypothetical protein